MFVVYKGYTVLLSTPNENATHVKSCQGKESGFLLGHNYSINQHALALEVIQVICFDGTLTIINLGKVTQFLACTAALSLLDGEYMRGLEHV